jgi:GAF domain-containing protein/HAMP domain-containing protein
MKKQNSENFSTGQPQVKTRGKIAKAVGFVLLLAIGLFAVFSLVLGMQTSFWQAYVGFGLGLAAFAACLLAIRESFRGRYELAGIYMIMGMLVVSLTGAIFYTGMGLPFGFVALVLILIVAILLLPARWATWVMLVGVVVSISSGIIDFLRLPVQIPASYMGNTFIFVGALAAIGLSALLLWQYRSMSLTNKLLVAFLFVTLLAAGIVAFVSTRSSTQSLTASVGALQASLAQAQARTVGDLLERQVDMLETLSLNELLQEKVSGANEFYSEDAESNQSKLERFDEEWKAASAAKDSSGALVQSRLGNMAALNLKVFSQNYPEHAEVFFTDRLGGLVAATNMTSDYYQADEPWWQAAWNNGAGKTYYGAPEYDESAGVISINIAVPIRNQETAEVIGVLRTTYMLDTLQEFIGAIRKAGTGDADLLFPGEPQLLMRDEGEITEADPEIALALENASSFDYTKLLYEGSPVLLSQAVVNSSDGDPIIEALGWRMIVNQDLATALAPVAAQTRSNLMAVMLVTGLIVGLAILSAQVLARPITQLTAVATRIREGDLNSKAQVESQDEIGELAETFNDMTSELRSMVEGLEQRVAERTRELAVAGEVSNILSQELDLGHLLKNAVELVRERFDLYYTQIYLYHPDQRSLVLRAGSGTAGAELECRGHRLPVSSGSINGKAAMEKGAIVVGDVAQSPNFRPNAILPETRSEAAVPMLIGDRLVGVLDLQSSRTGAFEMDSLPAFQALAGQLAVSVENATTFSQLQEAKKEVERRMQAQTRQGWMDFLDGIHRSEDVSFEFAEGTVRSSNSEILPGDEKDALLAPIVVSGENVGVLVIEPRPDQPWTSEQAELAARVADQTARQIENLRLLAQAERYRLEAEENARRLTRQGWDEYQRDLQSRLNFVYDQTQVRQDEAEQPGDSDLAYRHPLMVHDMPVGVLDFEAGQPLGEEDRVLIQTVAESLTAHIDNLRLTAQTQVALNNTETLNEVARAASRTLELDEVLDEILERILSVSEFGAGLISIEELATKKLRLVVHRNLPAAMVDKLTTVGLDGTPCDVVYRSGDTIALADLEQLPDDLHATNLEDGFVRQAMQRPLAMGFHSYFGLALAPKGQVMGTICLFDTGHKTIKPAKFSMLEAIGQQVGMLVDNARLFRRTQETLAETESLYDAISEMNAANNYDEILDALAKHTLFEQATPLLLMGVFDRKMGDGQRPEWFYPVAWRSEQPVDVAQRYPAALMTNRMESLAKERGINTSSFIDAGSPTIQAVQEMVTLDQPVEGVMGIPLILGGQAIGFVVGLFSQKTGPNVGDLQRLQAVAGQAAIAVESRLLLEQAQAKARQEQRLREVSANVFAASDVDAILRRAVEQVGRTLGAQAYIYLGQGNGTDGGSSGNGAHDVDETPEETVLVNG